MLELRFKDWIDVDEYVETDPKERGTLTFFLTGGLGNQFFQVAMAELVRAHGRQVRLDSGGNRSPFGGIRARELPTFPDIRHRPAHRCEGVPMARTMNKSFERELFELVNSEELCCVRGYFQYVELLQADQVRPTLLALVESVLERSNFTPEVEAHNAVHVRMGDYTRQLTAEQYGCLDFNYYQSCLEMMPDQQVLVVTDDHRALKRLIPEMATASPNITVLRAAEATSFHVLATAQSLAIGNSTFSLWAAWYQTATLNRSGVYFPSPWFRNGRQMDLTQLGWSPVGSEFLDPATLRLPLRRLRTGRLRALFW